MEHVEYNYWAELGCLHRLEREQRWDLQGYCDWQSPVEVDEWRARIEDRNSWEWVLHTGFRYIQFSPTIIDWEHPTNGTHSLDDKILVDKAS